MRLRWESEVVGLGITECTSGATTLGTVYTGISGVLKSLYLKDTRGRRDTDGAVGDDRRKPKTVGFGEPGSKGADVLGLWASKQKELSSLKKGHLK